jgi:hypothetical protein
VNFSCLSFDNSLGSIAATFSVVLDIGVVNYRASMEVATSVISNIEILRASFCDSGCDVTKCALIVAIDWEL